MLPWFVDSDWVVSMLFWRVSPWNHWECFFCLTLFTCANICHIWKQFHRYNSRNRQIYHDSNIRKPIFWAMTPNPHRWFWRPTEVCRLGDANLWDTTRFVVPNRFCHRVLRRFIVFVFGSFWLGKGLGLIGSWCLLYRWDGIKSNLYLEGCTTKMSG